MYFFCWTNNLWIPRQISTRFNQWVETIKLLCPYKFCQIKWFYGRSYCTSAKERNSCSVGSSFLDSRGWTLESVMILWKASVRTWVLLYKEEPNQKTHILRKTGFSISELKKSLVSMLITLKCRSSHRSKGRPFARFSTKPLWTCWLLLRLSDQKDKKSANAKQKPNEKIALLLDAGNFKMSSLHFCKVKHNNLP